jgi:hypothetical protein
MTDYKQLAEDLYEALKEANRYIANYGASNRVSTTLQKYEEATTRSTGRTTALYMKAITEALENPGKSIEFKDHYPHTVVSAKHHADNLETIIVKLGYDIMISRPTNRTQVYLYNKFGL